MNQPILAMQSYSGTNLRWSLTPENKLMTPILRASPEKRKPVPDASRSVVLKVPVTVHDFGLEQSRVIVPQLSSLTVERRRTEEALEAG